MAKKTAGQPTKYKPEHCAAIIAFFDVEPWETEKIDVLGDNGEVVRQEEGKRRYRRMPTMEGFAKSISICIHTVYNWVNPKHDSYQEEFLHSYNKALTYRKNWLVDVGLSGLAPANSFKFVAVNITDMRDKNEIKHDGSDSFIEALSKATHGKD
jgi:hypothetical protein